MKVFGRELTLDWIKEAYESTGLIPMRGSFHTHNGGGCALTAVSIAETGTGILNNQDQLKDSEKMAFAFGYDDVPFGAFMDKDAWSLGQEANKAMNPVHKYALV